MNTLSEASEPASAPAWDFECSPHRQQVRVELRCFLLSRAPQTVERCLHRRGRCLLLSLLWRRCGLTCGGSRDSAQ